ncbi:hypothetical protein D3C71_1543960 [compost metagenome]
MVPVLVVFCRLSKPLLIINWPSYSTSSPMICGSGILPGVSPVLIETVSSIIVSPLNTRRSFCTSGSWVCISARAMSLSVSSTSPGPGSRSPPSTTSGVNFIPPVSWGTTWSSTSILLISSTAGES